MASTRVPVVSLMRSFSVMDGTSAYRSGSAPVQSNTSSATSGGLLAEYPGAAPDAAEELPDALPGLGSPVEPLPEHAHPAGQFVAGVDGDDEVLDRAGLVRAGPVRAADEGGLDVRFDGGEQRMGLGQPLPGAQVQPAFGGSRRAGVEPGHLAGLRAVQEE